MVVCMQVVVHAIRSALFFVSPNRHQSVPKKKQQKKNHTGGKQCWDTAGEIWQSMINNSNFAWSYRLHYIWQIVTDLGFVFTTVVLHPETVGVHQIEQNANVYNMLLQLIWLRVNLVTLYTLRYTYSPSPCCSVAYILVVYWLFISHYIALINNM